jgi:hypothetical protein
VHPKVTWRLALVKAELPGADGKDNQHNKHDQHDSDPFQHQHGGPSLFLYGDPAAEADKLKETAICQHPVRPTRIKHDLARPWFAAFNRVAAFNEIYHLPLNPAGQSGLPKPIPALGQDGFSVRIACKRRNRCWSHG